jgi:hypothetical protein
MLPIILSPPRSVFGGAVAVTPWYLAGGIAAANCIAAYQPKGAASLAASYINLITPGTYDVAPGVAPTFSAATGWTFNGSTQYLDTGVSPAVAGTWSIFVQYTGLNDDACIIGSYITDGACGIWGYKSADYMRCYNGKDYDDGGDAVNSPKLVAGNYGLAGKTPYRNGVAEGNLVPAGGAISLLSPYIGAMNSSGVATQFMPIVIQAIAIYNITLTTQITALVAAMGGL